MDKNERNDITTIPPRELLFRLRIYQSQARFDYQDAEKKALPIVNELNRRGEVFSRKRGRKYYPQSFLRFKILVPKGGEKI